MVTKLVMSTSAEIGRSPMARSLSCSHCGEGPFFTPEISRPANIRHACGSAAAKRSSTAIVLLPPGEGCGAIGAGFSVPSS